MRLQNVSQELMPMLASEVVYQTLSPIFNIAPAPLAENQKYIGTYVTYQGISEESLNTVKAWTGHDLLRVQINVFDTSKLTCEKVAIQIKHLMSKQTLTACTILGGRDGGFDAETKLYMQQIDISIWQSED